MKTRRKAHVYTHKPTYTHKAPTSLPAYLIRRIGQHVDRVQDVVHAVDVPMVANRLVEATHGDPSGLVLVLHIVLDRRLEPFPIKRVEEDDVLPIDERVRELDVHGIDKDEGLAAERLPQPEIPLPVACVCLGGKNVGGHVKGLEKDGKQQTQKD